MADIIKEELVSRNIPLLNCIAVMSDSASVMRGQKGGVISILKKDNPNLLDVGGCSMHHVHNSVEKAMSSLGEELEEVIDDAFFYLRCAKAANSFIKIQKMMDLEPLKFLRRVETRWLQIYEVVQRFLELLPALSEFFSSLPASEQKKERVKRVRKFLDSAVSPLYMNFVLFALKTLKDFEIFFQTSAPVIHLIYDRMISIISDVCCSFIRQEYVDKVMNEDEFYNVPNVEQLSDDNVLIGGKAREALRNDHLTAAQRALFFQRVRLFYGQLLRSLIHYLPIGKRLLRACKFLDPKQRENVAEEDLIHVKSQLNFDCDADALLLEWRKFRSDAEIDTEEVDLPKFWKQIASKDAYHSLSALAKSCIILPHGNADTERLFSSMKRILTTDRNRLQDPNFNGILTVKLFMRNRGYKSATFPIGRKLLDRCYEASNSYMQYLKQKEKERIEAEKKKEEDLKAREKEMERERVRQEKESAEKLAESKRKTAMEYMEAAKRLMLEAQSITDAAPVSSKKDESKRKLKRTLPSTEPLMDTRRHRQ